MFVPEIDRANTINQLSFEITRLEQEQVGLVNQLRVMNDNPELQELCVRQMANLGSQGEVLRRTVSLIERTIRKIQQLSEISQASDPATQASSSYSTNNSAPFDINLWFIKKLSKDRKKLMRGAVQMADTYSKERGGSEEFKSLFLTRAQGQLEQSYQFVLTTFEQSEKTDKGLEAFLNIINEQSVALEEEKDKVSADLIRAVEPIQDLRSFVVDISRNAERLKNYKTECHRLELKPDEQLNVFEASQFGRINTIRQERDAGKLPNLDIKDSRGYGMLHIAAYAGQVSIVDYLLRQGADFSLKGGDDGFTAIHWAANRGHTEVIQLLYEAAVRKEDSIPPLIRWTKPVAKKYVNSLGGRGLVGVNSGTNETVSQPINRTPLHSAAYHLRSSAVNTLLRLGANPNAQTNECDDKKTPLIEAVTMVSSKEKTRREILHDPILESELNSGFRTIEVLLEHPDIDLKLATFDKLSKERKTVFHYAIDHVVDTGCLTILNRLFYHPTISSSIYFKDRSFLEQIERYAQSKEGPHQALVIYSILLYQINARVDQERQIEWQRIRKASGSIQEGVITSHPFLSPSKQLALVAEELERREQLWEASVREQLDQKTKQLMESVRNRFPDYVFPSESNTETSNKQDLQPACSSSADNQNYGLSTAQSFLVDSDDD